MANKYPLGEGVVVPMEFTFVDDPFEPSYAAYDPATPSFKLEHPDGVTIDLFTFPTSTNIKRHATPVMGKYWILLNLVNIAPGTNGTTGLPNALGTWRWKWFDPDPTKPGVKEGTFIVTPVKIA